MVKGKTLKTEYPISNTEYPMSKVKEKEKKGHNEGKKRPTSNQSLLYELRRTGYSRSNVE